MSLLHVERRSTAGKKKKRAPGISTASDGVFSHLSARASKKRMSTRWRKGAHPSATPAPSILAMAPRRTPKLRLLLLGLLAFSTVKPSGMSRERLHEAGAPRVALQCLDQFADAHLNRLMSRWFSHRSFCSP
ncbi:hypothetical protein MRX96_002428 [Rhipicephalus microplus]